ncbi:phage integrase SAM-like domain-containing protein [Gelidibacter pelagius]|uniref:phage integrase SAM-like domain-containing protein n=1 Tax=Gelidibacter pelagius TaxID=2819985 RepID=UPI00293D36E0|nr:phage integrase SAM-like domain-containing protein [Gelidibacter pelagius]
MDKRFLKRLMIYLKSTHKLSETSIMNIMVLIRLLFNRAIKRKIVTIDLYPIGGNKIKIKFPESNKVGLSIQQIQNIESLVDLSIVETHTRNVWLFSFYFAGMRVSAVLKIRLSDINDNRLQYRMHKNSKLISMKIPKKTLAIINKLL